MAMAQGYHMRITREQFYGYGGFSNPDLFRRMRSGSWCYYMNGR